MLGTICTACCILGFATPQEQAQDFKKVIAKAGDDEITEAHLQLVAMLSGHKEVTPKLRVELTRRLVETRHVARFLKRAGYRVNSAELAQATRDARTRLKADGIDLRKRTRAMKLSDSDLRRELGINKLWTRFKVKTLTTDKLKARFNERRVQYDGTRVRASQVFLKVPANDDAAWVKAEKKLSDLRAEVVAGKVSFADVAKAHSESPSAKENGDIGWFPYSGLMPEGFTRLAFALKKGEVSQPFRSRFGAHLMTVTDIDPGDLNLEDARPVIYRQLEQETWNAIVVQEKRRLEEKETKPRSEK